MSLAVTVCWQFAMQDLGRFDSVAVGEIDDKFLWSSVITISLTVNVLPQIAMQDLGAVTCCLLGEGAVVGESAMVAIGCCTCIHTYIHTYRVAQNKIPHQTICNIFATSGQILKILEAI